MGDFNYPGIDWRTSKGSSKVDITFIETLNDNYLHQHVREPTRGDRILDLVLSSSESDIDTIETSFSLGKSDHKTLIWNYLVPTKMKEILFKFPIFVKLILKSYGL